MEGGRKKRFAKANQRKGATCRSRQQCQKPQSKAPLVNELRKDNFKVLYCNCLSVIKKLEELKIHAFDLKPDVICLNETWTNSDHTNAFLALPGYEIVCRYDRTDTVNGCGGGLLVYRKMGLTVYEFVSDEYVKFNQC